MKNQGQGVVPETPEKDYESVRDFISIAVHDLREPLRGIRLGTQFLTAQDPVPSAESVERGTRYVLDGVERLETLIRDIGEYCYQEVSEPETRETELEMALLDAKNELAGELKKSGATLTHDPLPMVTGDPAALATVFRSLLSNACKFRSDAPLTIHVGALRQGSMLAISVRDNGTGFDPLYRKRIFKPFERLNGKQYPGSGLGLTLAKKIVERHAGEIWAESKLGQGATVTFSLPLAG